MLSCVSDSLLGPELRKTPGTLKMIQHLTLLQKSLIEKKRKVLKQTGLKRGTYNLYNLLNAVINHGLYDC